MEKLDTISARQINDTARKEAEQFVKDRLKTHQLRNVFSAIERMRSYYKKEKSYDDHLETQLILLKPKLAYAAGRQKSVRYNFFPFVEKAIDAVVDAQNKDKAISNFFALMESVVGYHKFFENK